MANFKTYSNQYGYDKGINLVQRNALLSKGCRIVPAQTSNRAISEQLYASLNLTPTQKASLDQALLERGIFDRHGNQLKAGTNQTLAWDYRNMLQTTVTDLSEGGKLKEDNTYAKAGQRNRKVTEKTDALDSTTEINESMYMGNLEYRTTWHGENLSYDGETVTEQSTGAMVSPYEQYTTLRIRQGHKQAAQKKIYTYKDGIKVTERATTYTLDNNIDSCELTLNSSGQVESYESYKPYGDIAISFGKTSQQPYKYSGQEKDQSGLYYYGFRSYLPANFRWMSPDPAGIRGSGLNWYAMVNGNPVTMRDEFGLGPFDIFMGRLSKRINQQGSLSIIAARRITHYSYLNNFHQITEGIKKEYGIALFQGNYANKPLDNEDFMEQTFDTALNYAYNKHFLNTTTSDMDLENNPQKQQRIRKTIKSSIEATFLGRDPIELDQIEFDDTNMHISNIEANDITFYENVIRPDQASISFKALGKQPTISGYQENPKFKEVATYRMSITKHDNMVFDYAYSIGAGVNYTTNEFYSRIVEKMDHSRVNAIVYAGILNKQIVNFVTRKMGIHNDSVLNEQQKQQFLKETILGNRAQSISKISSKKIGDISIQGISSEDGQGLIRAITVELKK